MQRAAAARAAEDETAAYPVSAVSGEGIAAFLAAVDDALSRNRETRILRLPASEGAALAWLHRHGDVLGQRQMEDGRITEVEVALDPADWERFRRQFGAVAGLR